MRCLEQALTVNEVMENCFSDNIYVCYPAYNQQSYAVKDNIFLPMRQNFFFFSGARQFCLGHRLRQLTRAVKSDVRTLNFRSDVIFAPREKHRMTFGKRSLCDVNAKNEGDSE